LETLKSPGISFWLFQGLESRKKNNAGPGKSWKSINSCDKVFFKNNFLQDYFWISISYGYIAFIIVHLGALGKWIRVLKKSWKIVFEKGYKLCVLSVHYEGCGFLNCFLGYDVFVAC